MHQVFIIPDIIAGVLQPDHHICLKDDGTDIAADGEVPASQIAVRGAAAEPEHFGMIPVKGIIDSTHVLAEGIESIAQLLHSNLTCRGQHLVPGNIDELLGAFEMGHHMTVVTFDDLALGGVCQNTVGNGVVLHPMIVLHCIIRQ